MTKRVGSPGRGLVGVAGSAGIGNLVFVRLRRGNEPERVRVHVDVSDRGLDPRHVAIHTFAAGRAGAVMRVLLERGRARAVRHAWSVAGKADLHGRQS